MDEPKDELDSPEPDARTAQKVPLKNRRAVDEALAYWEWLKGPRDFPSAGEIDPMRIPGIWRYAFVVDLAEAIPDSVVSRTGSKLREFCGGNPRGKRIADCLPPEIRAHMVALIEMATNTKHPAMESGTAGEAETLAYRLAVMPLSDDGTRIDRMLGILNFTQKT